MAVVRESCTPRHYGDGQTYRFNDVRYICPSEYIALPFISLIVGAILSFIRGTHMKRLSKGDSLLVVLLVYALAFLAGWLVYTLFSHRLLAFFLADVAATLVVWGFGLVFRNASVYDPYWSVAPPVLFAFFTLAAGRFDVLSGVYLFVFLFWGTRLTVNWTIGWKGMIQQDWRYTMLHDSMPKLWFFTNLFGINMFPTLIVFAGLMPAYLTTVRHLGINALTFVGAVVCLGAAILQIIADAELRRFRLRSKNAEHSVNTGLWKYSRHPNYLGEVSFWWGVWLIQLSVLPSYWWTVLAPALMTMMFLFISIPMMEKRLLASRTDYATYRSCTSALLLLPMRKQKGSEPADDVV